MLLTRRAALTLPVLAASLAARPAAATKSPPGAYLYIIWPQEGAHIKGAFWCRFGLRGMGVTHAGDMTANMGHHHLLIDVDESPAAGQPIPADKKHMHFGAGQTEARLDLPPGPHTLQLVLGDANHVPFDPPVMSKKISIVVT
jgi:hypothetical protein